MPQSAWPLFKSQYGFILKVSSSRVYAMRDSNWDRRNVNQADGQRDSARHHE